MQQAQRRLEHLQEDGPRARSFAPGPAKYDFEISMYQSQNSSHTKWYSSFAAWSKRNSVRAAPTLRATSCCRLRIQRLGRGRAANS